MAVEQDRTVVIPKQYDPRNGALPAFREAFDISRDQRMADHIRDHNHTIDQADEEGGALKNGRRRLSHRSLEQTLLAKKKKEKENSLLRRALKQLLDQINEETAAIDKRLEEIESELQELEHLQDLAEKGTLDSNNPVHAKLLQKYGITQDDIDNGNLLIILNGKLGQRVEEQTALQKRKERLQEQANEAIGEAQADGIITVVEADQFRQQLESSEAGVSAVAWDSVNAVEELQKIATHHHNHVLDRENSSDIEQNLLGLDFLDGAHRQSSVTASLKGDGSFQKNIQSEGKDLSIKKTFTASVDTAHDASQIKRNEPQIQGSTLKNT